MSAIPIKNVYYMLVYVFEMLKSKEYARLDREDCESIYDLLASLLLCGTNDLIKRGFLKSYINQTEELTAIRGRINIGGSIRRLSFQNAKAVCDFDEFNADIYFNQVIKATLLYLKRRPLNTNIKRDISKILLYFNEIGAMEINTIKWDSLVFNRNNAHYDTLLYFCRLIYEDAIANQSKGKREFRVLEDKLLPELFERFVCEFYRKHLASEYKVRYQKQIAWNYDENYGKPPNMYADVIIENQTQKLIIDTKFSKTTLQKNIYNDRQTAKSANLYQIFAYVINENESTADKTISGLLLYPQVNNSAVDLKHSIFGHNFYVRTVDLNQGFEEIKNELQNKLRDIFIGVEYEDWSVSRR
ncbi:MAG: hypothetical protein FWH17_02700 [Oscillospiraceae bacterium]|nr:hypothetical protein [Oscillospiraceae bacterium]